MFVWFIEIVIIEIRYDYCEADFIFAASLEIKNENLQIYIFIVFFLHKISYRNLFLAEKSRAVLRWLYSWS